jgi:hypothetical protein
MINYQLPKTNFMKSIFFIGLIACLISCTKAPQEQPTPQIINYPYTALIGHTWEGLSYTDPVTAIPYYQFLHITSDTTVGIYTASYDASTVVVPEAAYACKITTHPNHADALEIFYTGNSQPRSFSTTGDTTRITDGSVDYKRFK